MKIITKVVLDMETMKRVSSESYEYFGPVDKCCGPSGQQETLAAGGASLSSLLAANYQQNFGAQSKVLSDLNNAYSPIVAAGPDQQGFGPQELAALHTQAGEGVGANYAKASQALNNTLAARGGGNEVLPTGSEAQLRATLASSAANQLSNEELGITRANFATGRQNWEKATAGLDALSRDYNPTAFGELATGANREAFNEASKIQDMKNQKEASIAGGITSVLGSALTFGAGALGGGFAGGLSALAGGGFAKNPAGPAGMNNPEAVG
jgi:hypothetical protein